jgi:hypothetical protein
MKKRFFFYWTDSVTSKGNFVYADTEKEKGGGTDEDLSQPLEFSIQPVG